MLICWSPILATACQNMYMAPNSVDLLIDNFPYFAISEKLKFWTNSSPKRRWLVDHQLTLPKSCHFPNMCMGPKPVDLLIDNFGHFATSGKVKFWTNSVPKRCWFVDHQYWPTLATICIWVQILLICWLAIFQILTNVENWNFEPIALQNGVDLLITNWH